MMMIDGGDGDGDDDDDGEHQAAKNNYILILLHITTAAHILFR